MSYKWVMLTALLAVKCSENKLKTYLTPTRLKPLDNSMNRYSTIRQRDDTWSSNEFVTPTNRPGRTTETQEHVSKKPANQGASWPSNEQLWLRRPVKSPIWGPSRLKGCDPRGAAAPLESPEGKADVTNGGTLVALGLPEGQVTAFYHLLPPFPLLPPAPLIKPSSPYPSSSP